MQTGYVSIMHLDDASMDALLGKAVESSQPTNDASVESLIHRSVQSPHHVQQLVSEFEACCAKGSPLCSADLMRMRDSLHRQLLNRLQVRVEESMQKECDELLALVQLLAELLKRKLAAFQVVLGLMQDLLADSEEPHPPKLLAEAGARLAIAIAPVMHENDYEACYALEAFLQERIYELIHLAANDYPECVINLLESVLDLIDENWVLPEPSIVIQCQPASTGSGSLQLLRLSGELLAECHSDPDDMGKLRRHAAGCLGVAEHLVGLVMLAGDNSAAGLAR